MSDNPVFPVLNQPNGDDSADLELAQQLEEYHQASSAKLLKSTQTANPETPIRFYDRVRIERAMECVRLLDRAAAIDANKSDANSNSDDNVQQRLHAWNEFLGTERFAIKRWLGAGGMGTVFEAFDRERNESVALKTMNRVDPAALYYFKREFRSLADVHHQNLVKLHELFSVSDQWFFTMELLDGVDILSTLWESKSTEPVACIRWLEQVRNHFFQLASGLVALHDNGKLHRDIKPSNVLVTSKGRVVLVDFGLTKEFDPSIRESSTELRIVGTMAYMSPEQAAGRSLSPASDWYSVGVMLYEALTGRPPRFLNTDLQAVTPNFPQLLAVRPIPSDVDSANNVDHAMLCHLCMDLLSLRPEIRPKGSDVLGVLRTILHEPQLETVKILTAPFVGRDEQLRTMHEIFQKFQLGGAALLEIHGGSGMGKSALVQQFLRDLRIHSDRNVVLTGKCYERESVPHKALDSLIDALSHFLRRRKRFEAETFLPRDVSSLVKLFPVLQRVEAVVAAPITLPEIPDPQEIRRRAVAALKELLARIADRMPLILWIDDLQWGDIDSAAVLAELLSPPFPPPLMLIVSFRREDIAASPCILELRSALQMAGIDLVRYEIAVDALELSDAASLARLMLKHELDNPTAAPLLDDLADSIALESGGNPFFVGELVRHHRLMLTRGQNDQTAVDLQTVLSARIQDLPEPSRRLLEVVSVAGRPLGATEACIAAGLDDQAASIELLKEARLLRSLPSVSRVVIDVWHDRIREAVVLELSIEDWRQHHFRLALTLEEIKGGELEHLAMHFMEAGLPERACEYYSMAADRAAQSLAFERAAQLYRHSIEFVGTDHPRRHHRLIQLGDALANAGRCVEAAQIYLEAAGGAAPDQSLDLTRRAGLQYCITGHLDEGRAAFRRVLEELGMSFPSSRWKTLLCLIYYRTKLHLRGLKFRRRRPELISENERLRMAITQSIATGLCTNNPWMGALFQTRHLLQALSSGDPVTIGLAISYEAGYSAMEGGASWTRTSALIQQSQSLADETKNPHVAGFSELAIGISEFLCGRYLQAVDHNWKAEQIFRDRCNGVTWEQDTAQVFGLWGLFYMGQIAELRSRYQIVSREARERGDRYLMTTLGCQVGTFLHLVENDPIAARKCLKELMSRWTNEGFTVQHHNAMFAECMIDLYEGRHDVAIQRVKQTELRYHLSLLYRLQHVRIDLTFLKARLFVAAADQNRGKCNAWIRKASRCVRDLRTEKMPYASALANYVDANIVLLRQSVDGSSRMASASMLLSTASELARVNLLMLSKSAEWQAGLLTKGNVGDDLIGCAKDWFKTQSVENPECLLRAVSLTFLGMKSS